MDYTVKAVWNMDEARLKTIDFFLNTAELQFQKWDLEGLYWTLRSLKRMINAKLKEEEKEKVNEQLEILEEKRKEFLNNKAIGGEMFRTHEDFYELLTLLMKRHGIFFREGDDPRYAVLKR